MADIELVIKIPEETYEYWKHHSHEYVLAEAIKNGTPLPKGHGRLIDADECLTFIGKYIKNMYPAARAMLDPCKTIIEAESEVAK